MFPRFFIDRPIFATVLSLLFVLAGGLSVWTLPISQFPPVTPPTIQIDCNYPGASAQVVSETIAAPIEQQVNGVENMLYMTSQSTSDGSYTLTITFQIGTDLNMAQVLVQNRVALAMPNLPEVVRATGVTTRKRSPELVLTVSLNSPDRRFDQLYLSNYAVLRIKEELSRVRGISDVTIFGQRDYATRVWVDPDRLAARNLTALDVVSALRAQNLQVAAGQVGQPPVASGQPYQLTISTVGRLTEPEEFGEVVVKATRDGKIVKLKDVARVELGAKSSDISNQFDTKPTVGLAIFLLSDANALETADAVKARVDALQGELPEGIIAEIGYDTTPFIRQSIFEVFKSLRDSVILVAVVVLVFLQSWRSAIVPLLTVPVAIVGTFAAMAIVGFSLNNLTLFGLVLAVGIVVDDAIVVVEAVEHHIARGLTPHAATVQAMQEVTGPVVAVGAVLCAVFIPCTFLSGIVGQFFRQFALTIAISTLISTFNSLTLTPALCAILLKPRQQQRDPLSWILFITLGWFFWLFNRTFHATTWSYLRAVGLSIRVPVIVLAIYGAMLVGGGALFRQLPMGFIPSQDKGYLIASIQMPDAASAERTRAAIERIARAALDYEVELEDGSKYRPIKHTNAIAGNSFVLSSYGSNFGSMFIILDSFDNRQHPKLHADVVAAELRKKMAREIPEAQVNVFGAPAVSGLGRAGGFRMMIEDRGDVGARTLQAQTDNLIEKMNAQPKPGNDSAGPGQGIVNVFTVFKADAPQAWLDIDRDACVTHGVEISEVAGLLQATMGQRYVNDFNRFGRTWQVTVQAEQRYRNELEDVKRLRARNKFGGMTPLGAVLKARYSSGPQVVTRYNMYPAAAINGAVSPGVSSGDAIAIVERLADQELPDRMAFEWTELTYLERLSRDTGLLIFGLSAVFVFLVLAALYESWALPLAVIVVVPMCVVSSIAGLWLNGQTISDLKKGISSQGDDINLFTQIGFIVLIGLACKNAILIVEFAKHKRDTGASRRDAVLDACRLRFRPIIMTSFSFILGVAPLLVATGAGAEMRRALGTAVFSGMVGVTLFGVILTPSFFVVVDWLTRREGQSRRLMRFSQITLDLLRLGPLWRILGRTGKAIGSRIRPGRKIVPNVK